MIIVLIAALAVAGDAPTAPAPPVAKKEAKICRTMEVTGTRMGSRSICKTAEEWQREKDDAERVLNGRRDVFDAEPARPAGP